MDRFAALADPTRRSIVEMLGERPLSAGEVGAAFSASAPAISQHLKVLREAGLVSARAEGTRRVYAVSNAGFFKLNLWLDQFWEA